MAQIMIVDDDRNSLRSLNRTLSARRTHTVDAFESSADAISHALSSRKLYDIIISDYRMPGDDGITFLKRIKQILPTAARVMLTGFVDRTSLNCAINEAQVDRYLEKPINPDVLHSLLANILHDREHHKCNQISELMNIVEEQKRIIEEQAMMIEDLRRGLGCR